MFFFIITF